MHRYSEVTKNTILGCKLQHLQLYRFADSVSSLFCTLQIVWTKSSLLVTSLVRKILLWKTVKLRGGIGMSCFVFYRNCEMGWKSDAIDLLRFIPLPLDHCKPYSTCLARPIAIPQCVTFLVTASNAIGINFGKLRFCRLFLAGHQLTLK